MTEYVLSSDRVKSAFWSLVEQPVHSNFPGYLCLVWLATDRNTTTGLNWGSADYEPFFERFFSVDGGLRSYLKPFAEGDEPADETLWFGSNLPGTYSTSTMERSNTGISRVLVIEETGYNSQVALHDDHVAEAKSELLHGQSISATELSMYLYRNFIFEAEDREPTAEDLVDVFKSEFGYTDSSDFDELFTVEDEEGIFSEVDDA